jgi:very-short-patch-repair endonuclease
MTDDKPRQFTSSPEQWAKLKSKVQEMRHNPTPAENVLWQRLRNRRIGGAKFRRQHAIEGFIVDFVSIEYRLIIEVDGDIQEQAEQQAYDAQRQAFLEAQGFRVLRFNNGDMLQSTDAVVQMIGDALKDIKTRIGEEDEGEE